MFPPRADRRCPADGALFLAATNQQVRSLDCLVEQQELDVFIGMVVFLPGQTRIHKQASRLTSSEQRTAMRIDLMGAISPQFHEGKMNRQLSCCKVETLTLFAVVATTTSKLVTSEQLSCPSAELPTAGHWSSERTVKHSSCCCNNAPYSHKDENNHNHNNNRNRNHNHLNHF